ncbi:MAG: hypothetical protein ABJD24_05175 [Acidimicrobiales bacterium]
MLCGAAVLKFRSQAAPDVAVESKTVSRTDATSEVTVGSASTFPPVELTSTTDTAVLVGTASPGAVVLVLGRQAVADASGAWRITVDLVPGINHFQAVATEPSGLQVATNFTVIYTPPATSAATSAATTSAAPPTISNATTPVVRPATTATAPPAIITNTTTTVAVNVPVTISSPLDGAVVAAVQITVSGTAAPGARVNAAGTLASAAENGLWSAFVTLKPGTNRLTVTATTPAGVTSASITVRYNPRATTTSVPPQTTTIPVDTEPPPP